MTYIRNLPLKPDPWQTLPHRPVAIESEWWGWGVLDLMVGVPSILMQYLQLRLRTRRLAAKDHRAKDIRAGEKDKSSWLGALSNRVGK